MCAWPGVARAQPSSPVRPAAAEQEASGSERALIERGIALRKAEDDRGARDAFASAWASGGSPEALAQLALSEQALGLWLDAYEHLGAALQYADDGWIVKHRHILESALAEIESRFGRLEVTCNVAGSEVSLDGRVVGTTPLAAPLRLLAGRSVIRLSAEGYFDVARQVQIDAGGLARLDVALTSSAGASPPEAST
ncbi:MAG TPA: PEGA domain-containing protein, partial [Polyangiaceae bacterium]|nr:PEGA domain-containing protein [Polyangiaceae bacterium]